MITIRLAQISDIPDLLDSGRQFYDYAELKRKGLTFHAGGLLETLKAMIDNPSALILVAEKESKFLGSIAGIVFPLFFNPKQKMVSELWWWVLPEARGTQAGKKLLDKLQNWGKEVGASMFDMTAVDNDKLKSLDRLYCRAGFVRNEVHYLKRL